MLSDRMFVSFTAFIQSESIIEVLRFDDGGLLQVILFYIEELSQCQALNNT